MWLAVVLLWSASACTRASASVAVDAGPPGPAARAKTLSAKRASAPVQVDGKLEEADWLAAASTGPFPDANAPGVTVTHTEARATWDDEALYVALYAADEDLGSDDHVDVSLRTSDGGTLTWEVPPAGPPRCRRGREPCGALPGVQAGADSDGTMNDPSDDDEEWAVELAVPWSALGYAGPPTQLAVELGRHDRPKGAASRRQSWPGVLRLERPSTP